jgi:hypothetical protein
MVMTIQNRHSARLMEDPDVIGTATGMDTDGTPNILLLVTSNRALQAAPKMLDGVRVKVRLTDPIVAVKGPPGGPPGNNGDDPQARQDRPIPLGVSGGNVNDLANGYCCSGTLGALVQQGGTQYILSNSHVLAGDIASSAGDPDVSEIGDPINQPGLIDINCQNVPADYVANLSSLSTLNTGANVDCAIAEVIPGMVDPSGTILSIGTISSQTLGASVGLDVKKSGRTTGLTRSTVEGINATVNVGYGDECNGQSFTKQFTGQILVDGRVKGKSFLSGGDSGSLMVEDVDNNPRAVGLLFAGSSQIAVANPINDVLSHHNVTLVGN